MCRRNITLSEESPCYPVLSRNRSSDCGLSFSEWKTVQGHCTCVVWPNEYYHGHSRLAEEHELHRCRYLDRCEEDASRMPKWPPLVRNVSSKVVSSNIPFPSWLCNARCSFILECNRNIEASATSFSDDRNNLMRHSNFSGVNSYDMGRETSLSSFFIFFES